MSDSLLTGSAAEAPATEEVATETVETTVEHPAAPVAEEAPSWMSELPDDIRNDPSMKVVKDIPNLAKMYIHSQRQLGADKIVVPNKYATDEEWQGIYSKLGLPESADKYELSKGEGEVNDDFFKGFREKAHAAGVLPKQAQQIFDWYQDTALSMEEELANKAAAEEKKAVDSLRQEWGEAFDSKVTAAQVAVNEFGGDEIKAYLNETGLGNDPKLIKLFAKIGESLGEDVLRGTPTESGITPGDYGRKIKEVMGNKEHPYWDKNHPEHRSAIKEMQVWYEKSTPEQA